VSRLAEEICDLAERWGVRRVRGFCDDACFARTGADAGSIADQFARCGVHWRRARKGARVAGWARMRTLLAAAGSIDQPGLYISRACGYFWQTVPYLSRDPRRLEDVDSRAPDHAADAARYALAEPAGLTARDLYNPTSGLMNLAGGLDPFGLDD